MAKHPLPTHVFSSQEIRQAELDLVRLESISLFSLVERAAASAFDLLFSQGLPATPVVVAGSGNNGSDALMLARMLADKGASCRVLRQDSQKYTDENEQAFERLMAAGVRVEPLNRDSLHCALTGADFLIDGLLGTGVKGAPREDVSTIIEMINSTQVSVLSLDLPSGLNANTGRVHGVAVIADLTICFGALKQGLFTSDARDHCGDICFGDIGLQAVLPVSRCRMLQGAFLQQVFRPRRQNSHKGNYGKVCIVGGDQGMSGAVRLAGEACLRAGVGLVKLVSHWSHASTINLTRPELMVHGCELVDMETYQVLGWPDVLVIGPGLGVDDWGFNLFKAALMSDKPMLLDADALNLLVKQPEQRRNWVLTPHPAEAARLLNCSVAEVENDRFAAVDALQNRYGGVVVLKGSGTVISDGNEVVVAPVGNPGLASGGCGDVLSGIIGALLAQGFAPMTAAVAGVILHGDAADLAAAYGIRGMLASDLMSGIRQLVNPL
ncbi:NAD(P)H-hydrate dehydratase [Shewanella submarina]|uniref:Bifunctional NAD(P)H-hydrate repair enzyme n=1 Tax=Shewanella submarina TaxID=2016376 RepID=A0ABV7GAU0_9GAMM|nr:NAD(P)H-hydrate dehydratase [Shewanella submarina]MCL1039256.1 NAD(P)H-hydrate dehydratase [Shewanella submarina]